MTWTGEWGSGREPGELEGEPVELRRLLRGEREPVELRRLNGEREPVELKRPLRGEREPVELRQPL